VTVEVVNVRGLLLLLGLLSVMGPAWVRNALGSQTAADARWDRRFAPPGVQGTVLAMAFDQNRIYLAGAMQSVGRVPVEAVAEGDAKHWRNLPDGPGQNEFLFPNVLALAIFKGDLYAGGYFDDAGGYPAGGLAQWNGNRLVRAGGHERRGLFLASR